MARASVDKQIWQARKQILDLEEQCGRVANNYDFCSAAFVEQVADTLRNVNWILYDAEGDAIRERQQRSED